MEAIFAKSLDITYVGPSPALNAYVKYRGEEIRLIAGSANGGAALVVHADSGIGKPSDFRGKRIATPQLGNTQDVACRAWLISQGFRVTQLGGDVRVVPTANPDQLTLMKTRGVDAVWTVEPWVSRLEMEANGRIFIEERDAVTTVVAASTRMLREQREVVKKFAQAHTELTNWIKANPAEAQRVIREELGAEMKHVMSPELITRAWNRLQFTAEVALPALETYFNNARKIGFLRGTVDLSRLLETP